uniref:RNA polymerase subunit alpha n=1 Tax=Ophirina amphinema TaxID=2108040 RepID=A0A348AYS1_9EUKA|nr:RNA polymerase subunit alpha [Ophirina amphinema]
MDSRIRLQTRLHVLLHSRHRVRFLVSPIEKNFSLPFSNVFRSMMLENIFFPRVTCFRLNDYRHLHEAVIESREDLYQISGALNKIKVCTSSSPLVLTLHKKGPCMVYASDFKSHSDSHKYRILNGSLPICEVYGKKSVKLSVLIEYVRGRERVFQVKRSLPNGIEVEHHNNPIQHVSYNILSYRTYDEVLFDIISDGTINVGSCVQWNIDFLSYKFRELNFCV